MRGGVARPANDKTSDESHAVVVGGGIVGLTTAHFLLEKGWRVTLVEKCAIACHSSGKGGGFLTDGDSGWHQGAVCSLAKRSFTLHRELADRLGRETIGYRKVRCVCPGTGSGVHANSRPDWLTAGYDSDMARPEGMAQITPYMLMEALHADVVARGCEVLIGKVVGVQLAEEAVTAVNVERDGKSSPLPCTSMVIAMGPWSQEAAEWFPGSAMPRQTVSNRYTSVIWDDQELGKDATMVFTMGNDAHTEIYPRLHECYANGCPSTVPLPDDPLSIEPPPEEVARVRTEASGAAARLKDTPILRTTACFLAGSDDNVPVIGNVPGICNAVIACGGGCWGILNGPAMGEAAAALAAGNEPELDISMYSPERFGGASGGQGLPEGLPPKLRAVLAQNPQLAVAVRERPELLSQISRILEQAEQAEQA